jgi:hypothetical protein
VTMVKPPFPLVIGTWLIALVSCLFFIGERSNSSIGYAATVVASIAGGVTALTDQKRRGDSNYMAYDSFRWVLISVRYFIVFTAIVHIVRLAVNAANGGWRLF